MNCEYISAYEYEKNVEPKLENIPIVHKNIDECDYGITFIDFSKTYNMTHKCTSPNLLASFIKIKANDNLILFNTMGFVNSALETYDSTSFVNGTSHLFYIMNSECEFFLNECESFFVFPGDIFVCPNFDKLSIVNKSNNNDLTIYYVNDSPLINFLGCKPYKQTFKPSIYNKNFLLKNLKNLSIENNNRKGILLSNKDTEKIGNNTITPVLWALYNELPPNTIQRPHKHNSVALDLCIKCDDTDNIYTLIGDELDENGNIKNPKKINWNNNEMFITPPGMWHSHNNTGNTFAYILPIQDAGLLLYQRILGIKLT
jgi:gentisate 1,2-dioxygenase